MYAVWSSPSCYVENVVAYNNKLFNVYYASFDRAISDIGAHIFSVKPTSYTVKLMTNVTVSTEIVVRDNINIYAVNSALKITPSVSLLSSSTMFTVTNGYTLVLSEGASNKIAYTLSNALNLDGEYVVRQKSLIKVESGGTLEVKGLNVFGGNAVSVENGGAISIFGTAVISNSTFSLNSAYEGGAIYVGENSNLTVTDCFFGGSGKNNNAISNGGAIYIENDAHVNFVGDNTFAYNTALNGGALYLSVNATDVILGKTFFVNNSATNGGALYLKSALILGKSSSERPDFENNRATNGGAIYAENKLEVLFGETFVRNTATENGGAIYSATNLIIKN
ncbi:MAG: hypothetical protein EOM05_12655, partial [Clostridia bacterium]|nr:hypothetical protein [Clostridia bacterium]